MSAIACLLVTATAGIGAVDCDRLPPRQIDHLGDLPKGVIEAIGETMADRGQPFQATDMILFPDLPHRRFARAEQRGCVLTITYEQGGIAHRWERIILKRTGERWRVVSRH